MFLSSTRRMFTLRNQMMCVYDTMVPLKRQYQTATICHGKFTKFVRSLLPKRKVQKKIEGNPLEPNNVKHGKKRPLGNTVNGEKNLSNKTKKVIRKRKTPKILQRSQESSADNIPDYLYTTKSKNKNSNHKLPDIQFEPYISEDEYLRKLEDESVITGVIRINPRNFRLAYIGSQNGVDRDIVIESVESRNRALPGDIVAVQILPKDEWRDEGTTKTGKVVYLVEKKHTRTACGMLRPYRNHRFGFALFSPVDRRLPRVMIPLSKCPENFVVNANKFDKTLFVGNIESWDEKMPFASGCVVKNLGESGLIEPETEAILINNDIDSSDFSSEVLKELPDPEKWRVTKKEIAKRRDLRDHCIFSVDPATARDLDDALSCRKINDDTFEVGVHIADVSHFIREGSVLDKTARDRATSVYLTQQVIPMLPSVLCEELCSLNPGVERLAYSVIWTLKSNGTKLDEWFGRSVIRSCTKLSYNHAQQMIETDNPASLQPNDFPEIHDKRITLQQISQTVKHLYGIAKNLRDQRFSSGALDFSESDIAFNIDHSTGMPNGCSLYEYKDSNKMIEEFMLLANMAVGDEIFKHFPKRAVLRCHPPPLQVLIEQVESLCRKFDIPFDASDSSHLNKSLNDINKLDMEQNAEDIDEKDKKLFSPALNLLCMKSFKNAKYFCTGSVEDESQYRHYALNVPIYTHFTSPIRRYPDILVHRLLTAALDQSFNFRAKSKQLQIWADHCTAKKLNADMASEQSSALFFAVYVMEHGPLVEKGVIVNVSQASVDILCPQTGTMSRVYLRDVEGIKDFKYSLPDEKPLLELEWCPVQDDVIYQQNLTMFTPVNIELKVNRNEPTKVVGTLLNPNAMSGNESLKDQSLV
eukprot:TCONS_00014453-protein